MLFDHSEDPMELNNLAEKEVYRDTVVELAAELRKKWGEDFLKRPSDLTEKGEN